MNRARKTTVSVTLAVLLVSLAGSYLTRGAMESLPFLHGQPAGWTGTAITHGIVDQRPWQTASTLAGLAVSAEEQDLAREAKRLADHEVDQAFAQSLRQASMEARVYKGAALLLQRRVVDLQRTVSEDQLKVNTLTAQTGAVGPPDDSVDDDLDIAKAQLILDQSELSDSTEDLARESGDQRQKIQQELSAREAAMKKSDPLSGEANGQAAVVSAGRYKTLAGQIAASWAQRNRMQLLEQAEQLARADVTALTADHARIEAGAKTDEENLAAGLNQGKVKRLQRMAEQRNILSIIDDRLGAQQQLAALYQRWEQQVSLQRKIVLHLISQSVTIIAVIVLLTILTGGLLQVALVRFSRDRRQMQTLRIILNLATQLVGLVLILLVIFGIPAQTPTILGLATAGLTVVFQDFILAFCGWFVLMGPNGIRIGDWVEIDSVGGEAVQIGLFRTWLLETGNWTANGHPTGRRVSFLNGFAIRGKYFNFSTAGQWMWDEIKVNIPPGEENFLLIEQIRDAAVKATEADATMAEEEWKRVTHEEGLPQFSATPSINVRPAAAGIDIVVRYVTRAGRRLETRNQLFGKVVELMGSVKVKVTESRLAPSSLQD